MKVYSLTLFGFLMIFFIITNAEAQIDSLKIAPNNPTTIDSVYVISYTTFSSSGCDVSDSSVNIIGSTITLYALSWQGNADEWCHSADTLLIGKLNSGTYELIFYLRSDDTPPFLDIDTIMFTVQHSFGIETAEFSDQEINIFPNPAINEIHIDLKAQLDDCTVIEIYSLTGQKLKSVMAKTNPISIDIKDLNSGVFFILITTGQGYKWAKKIIISAP